RALGGARVRAGLLSVASAGAERAAGAGPLGSPPLTRPGGAPPLPLGRRGRRGGVRRVARPPAAGDARARGDRRARLPAARARLHDSGAAGGRRTSRTGAPAPASDRREARPL